MNNSALLTLLAVLMAAATNIAAADDSSAPLLEPLYPENYQGEEEEERDLRFSPARARSISLETAGGLEPAQTPPDYRLEPAQTPPDYLAKQLRGVNPMEEARRGEDLRAVNEEARRAALDGGSGRNTFGIPLPP